MPKKPAREHTMRERNGTERDDEPWGLGGGLHIYGTRQRFFRWPLEGGGDNDALLISR